MLSNNKSQTCIYLLSRTFQNITRYFLYMNYLKSWRKKRDHLGCTGIMKTGLSKVQKGKLGAEGSLMAIVTLHVDTYTDSVFIIRRTWKFSWKIAAQFLNSKKLHLSFIVCERECAMPKGRDLRTDFSVHLSPPTPWILGIQLGSSFFYSHYPFSLRPFSGPQFLVLRNYLCAVVPIKYY